MPDAGIEPSPLADSGQHLSAGEGFLSVDGAVKVVVLAVAYTVTGWLGLLLAIPPGFATAVWPPSGIALAGHLLWGQRVWPGVWVGSFLVNVWVSLTAANAEIGATTLAVAAGIAVGSTLQAILGAFLLKQWGGADKLFDRGSAILAFAAIEALSCLLAPTWGVTSLCLAGVVRWESYFDSWRTWWIGDLIGVLVVTPVLLTWRQRPRIDFRPWRLVEAIVSLALLAAMTGVVFVGPSSLGQAQYPMAFLPLPCLVWMAFRFAPGGVSLATLFLSGIAVSATSLGSGPFVRDVTNDSLLMLQAYMGLATMTGLTLAAAVTGHKQAEAEIRKLNAELEQRVRERTSQLAATVGELQRALAEIRTLKGLIPICAWCKKIRDDQGFWQQLESYLRAHTEAKFSHGICPECLKEQFDDVPQHSEKLG